RRIQAEEDLGVASQSPVQVDEQIRVHACRRSLTEQQAQVPRTQLDERRLVTREMQTRPQGLQVQLRAAGTYLGTVLSTLPEGATEADWEQQLARLDAQIQRLGAINLAAIEEYEQQSERKRYLDAQNADLEEALQTLEQVIRKIDKETRNRFKETFDK